MIPSRTWRRPPRKRGLFVQPAGQAPTAPPVPRGAAPQPPSQVTLGDKAPEMALKDACPTPELAPRKTFPCPAQWASSSPFPRRSKPAVGWVGDSLGAQAAPGTVLRQRCPFTLPKHAPEGEEHRVAPRKVAMPLKARWPMKDTKEGDIGHQVTSGGTAQPSAPSRGTCSAPQLSLSLSLSQSRPHEKCSPVPWGKRIPIRTAVNSSTGNNLSTRAPVPTKSQHRPGKASFPHGAIRADFPSFIFPGIHSFSGARASPPSDGRTSSQYPI